MNDQARQRGRWALRHNYPGTLLANRREEFIAYSNKCVCLLLSRIVVKNFLLKFMHPRMDPKFGQTYNKVLCRRSSRSGDRWHLDEVFLKINERIHYLWRTVDQDGDVLDILVRLPEIRRQRRASIYRWVMKSRFAAWETRFVMRRSSTKQSAKVDSNRRSSYWVVAS